MAPTNQAALRVNGVGQIRARLLTALHVGRLRPGDRVPSVRRLAHLTGINHKTVHRAYTALAREGILRVQPGSGTFVTERRTGGDGLPETPGLLGALRRCRSEASQLGLAPNVLSRFLHICLSDGLRGVPVGLVECNREQITMISLDLRRSLGVEVRPILLDTLERDPARAIGEVGAVVTTDCHWTEVAERLEPHGVPTYTITLDQRFPRYLLRVARRNEVVIVANDRRFGQVFTRLLEQLTDDDALVPRIRFVNERDAPATLRSAKRGTWVYLSPLLAPAVLQGLPPHVRHVKCCWHVEPSALESLRAGLALDCALGDTAC